MNDLNFREFVDLQLPNLQIPNEIPSLTRQGKIVYVDRIKNPIPVMLSDGTRLFFTLDEYNRIKGSKPETGKHMTVTLQRRQDDKSETPSQIVNCIVH